MSKNKIKLFFDENITQTRKEFIKTAFTAGAVIAMPITILPGCNGSSDNDPSPGPGVEKSTFDIIFSSPMDTASVEEAVTISPDTPDFFASAPVWSENDTIARFECADGVPAGNYTLLIAGTAKAKNGLYLDGNGDGTGGDDYEGGMVF